MFAIQHGRDQLFQNWPKLYTAKQSADLPAEELVALRRGGDYGWPECYYDQLQKRLVLAPEYGGDGGHKAGVCDKKLAPVVGFPGHWAPNDMLIYTGNQFPAAYQDGAFIAFHGSWNRAPEPQGGYNVVFQPLKNGTASGPSLSLRMVSPASSWSRAAPHIVRPAWPWDRMARSTSPTTKADASGALPMTAPRTAKLASAAPVLASVAAGTSASPPEGIHPDAGATPLPIPPDGSPDQVALGDRIFHGQADGGTCAGCHGADGKGSPVGSDLTSGKWVWSDGSVASIAHVIRTGVAKPATHTGVMAPSGGIALSDADLTAVADYVWAIGHRTGK